MNHYLTTSNNILSDPPLHEDDEVFMGLSDEEIIPLPLDRDMLDESMSSDAGGSLSLSISLQVLLDTDRTKSLIETIHSGSLLMNQNTLKKRKMMRK